MRGLAALAGASILVVTLVGAAFGTPQPTPGYTCNGAQFTLFDNTNGNVVSDGAGPPTFKTKGPECVRFIQTYHWNSGKGQAPGTLGLRRLTGPGNLPTIVGPFPAKSSSGQNNAPNVNWYVGVPPIPSPMVINGTYQCIDSGTTTWSGNAASGGVGFCIVYATPAQLQGKPCACENAAAKVVSLTTHGKTFALTYRWTVGCTAGEAGGCSATIRAGAPKIKGAGKITFASSSVEFSCGSDCGTSHSGIAVIHGLASKSLALLKGKTFSVPVLIACAKHNSSELLSARIK